MTMAVLPKTIADPTFLDIDKALEEKQKLEAPRNYLGMSQIGEPCWRKLFYSFRNAEKRVIPAQGIRAIQDGYTQENVMIERLKMLPYIQLHNDDGEGNQIGFQLLQGHLRGHVDGMISGIKQAPKSWHVWEHKSVNETKFNKLKKLIEGMGEKNALSEWDEIYFAQAQIYMHCAQVDRHYLTVTTPGGRDYISCRTNYNKKIVEDIITKAKVIIFDNWSIPAKLSEKREFYKCKWCEYSEICHDGKFPLVNCKTCRYSEPIDGGVRKCLYKEETLDNNMLNLDTCQYHIYNPALLDVKLIEHQSDCCILETKTGFKFANCNLTGFPDGKDDLDGIYTSHDLRNKIQFTHNLTKETAKIQKNFNGTFSNKKIWDNATVDL